jgi:UDP-hydrolysing UDP-N-acetyl-D-glucosamine 2-epimerase
MRKILVFTAYRSEYLKIRSVLLELKKKDNIDLRIVSLGAHNLNRFGNTIEDIKNDGLEVSHHLYTNVEGNDPSCMAQSVGIGLCQVTPILAAEKPDIVLIAADRYDIFSVAIASSLSNFVLAHAEGGEVTGTIDENIRHSITKLAHIHFPATELSKKRIIQMGENPENVFNLGCPFMDYIKDLKINKNKQQFLKKNFPSLSGDYGIIIQHPVTIEHKQAFSQMRTTLSALQEFGMPCLLVWPNADAGAEEVSRAVRMHSEKYKDKSIIAEAWRTIKTDLFLNLLYHSNFLIGNSSSGIRETHVYGVPSINIGSRQQGRERTKNVIDVDYDEKQIYNALVDCAWKKIYDENLYGDGTAGKKIANVLEKINLKNILNKKFRD